MVTPDFSGVPLDVQERLALREAQYAVAADRGAAFMAAQTAMTTVEGVASSFNGEVRVVVSSRGLLVDVQISARGLALGPRALSRLLTVTIREALLDLQNSLTEAVLAVDRGVAAETVIAEVNAGLASPLSALDDPTPPSRFS